jgi:hypothetical protein
VAGDIVRTAAAQPTLTRVAVLAIIVLIRAFLSLSLGIELTGRWPWQSDTPVRPPEQQDPRARQTSGYRPPRLQRAAQIGVGQTAADENLSDGLARALQRLVCPA